MDDFLTQDDIIDRETVASVKEDPEKIAILFKKYYWPILMYVRQRLDIESRSREDDAEDITMIAFEYSLKAINKHDSIRSYKALIYGYAKRLVYNHFLLYKSMYQIVDQKNEDDSNAIVILNPITPEQECIEDEFKNYLHQLIALMPKQYAQVAKLCYINDLAYNKIASILHVPKSTIISRLEFVRDFLRKKLSPNKTIIKSMPISFTENEITFIKNNFHSLRNEDLLKEINKMRDIPIRITAFKKYYKNVLNLKHSKLEALNKFHNFSEPEIEYIKKNFNNKTIHQLTEEINTTRITPVPHHAVHRMIYRTLKINKKYKEA